MPRILVLDDDALISVMLQDWLDELGHQTLGPAATAAAALALIADAPPDAAILDLSVGQEMSYPVAEALRARRIPFAFATGYGSGGLPPPFADIPVLVKPFDFEAMKAMLTQLLQASGD